MCPPTVTYQGMHHKAGVKPNCTLLSFRKEALLRGGVCSAKMAGWKPSEYKLSLLSGALESGALSGWPAPSSETKECEKSRPVMECQLAWLRLAALGKLYLYHCSQGKYCSISGDESWLKAPERVSEVTGPLLGSHERAFVHCTV
jgi:hypothetical protein